MPKFEPSQKSLTSEERTLVALSYLRRAADALEAEVKESGEVPPWVLAKILQARQEAGMAVSYVRRMRQARKDQDQKKGKKP